MKKYEVELFLDMIRDNKAAFFRASYSFLLNKEDAEDAVSNAVLKAYTHLSDLRSTRKMKAWFYGILVNECKDMLRKQKQISYVSYETEEVDIEKTGPNEEMPDLYRYICQSEPVFREVIILFYFAGFNGKEIARMLDVPEGTVKSRLSRAKKKLKNFIEKEADLY